MPPPLPASVPEELQPRACSYPRVTGFVTFPRDAVLCWLSLSQAGPNPTPPEM